MSQRADVLTAHFRVTTPMFLSGADQSQAELRLPSLKGALRFWWRALNWSRYRTRLAELKAEEARLFGGTGKGEGQALFLLRLTADTSVTFGSQSHFKPNTWDGYIGYGLTDARSRPTRRYVAPGSTFQMLCRGPHAQEADWRQLRQAIKALGLLGGLGGRSRKGWGSLTLQRFEGMGSSWEAPSDAASLRAAIAEHFDPAHWASGSAPYSAFNQGAHVVIGSECKDSAAAHRKLAELYREQVRSSTPKPSREAFGLPRKSAGRNADARRASPVFLHVHQASDRSPAIPVVAFLPARFLEQQDEPSGGWQPVTALLDKVQP